MDLRKINLQTKAQQTKAQRAWVSEAVTTEFSEEQLSSVSGGKASAVLMKACATGTHIREATITH